MKRAFIFFNGELSGNTEFYKRYLKKGGDIYCADGGAMHAYALGEIPIEIMGDMDSASVDVINYYREKGTAVKIFHKDKDFTDGEIILEYVNSKNYDEIIVFAAMGGRTDHMLTNLNLLFKYNKVRFISGQEEIMVIDKTFQFNNYIGKEVSFIPFSDEVTGITLRGFKFPLEQYTLKRWSSICMSNVISEVAARVSFEKGKLLCIIQKF